MVAVMLTSPVAVIVETMSEQKYEQQTHMHEFIAYHLLVVLHGCQRLSLIRTNSVDARAVWDALA